MGDIMKKLLLLGLMLLPLHASAQAAPTPISPADITWGEPAAAGPTPGASSVMLVGSSSEAGLYVQRVKLAPGGKINPHTHNDERVSVVLEGSIMVGFGETFDENNMVEIPTGGLYVAPAGVPHYIWANNGPALYQENGFGPSVTGFIQGR
jgi:quercetin dioxygenase-like cupin family protein